MFEESSASFVYFIFFETIRQNTERTSTYSLFLCVQFGS